MSKTSMFSLIFSIFIGTNLHAQTELLPISEAPLVRLLSVRVSPESLIFRFLTGGCDSKETMQVVVSEKFGSKFVGLYDRAGSHCEAVESEQNLIYTWDEIGVSFEDIPSTYHIENKYLPIADDDTIDPEIDDPKLAIPSFENENYDEVVFTASEGVTFTSYMLDDLREIQTFSAKKITLKIKDLQKICKKNKSKRCKIPLYATINNEGIEKSSFWGIINMNSLGLFTPVPKNPYVHEYIAGEGIYVNNVTSSSHPIPFKANKIYLKIGKSSPFKPQEVVSFDSDYGKIIVDNEMLKQSCKDQMSECRIWMQYSNDSQKQWFDLGTINISSAE